MSPTGPNVPRGVLVALPAALALLVMFFLPWVQLSCDTGPAGITPNQLIRAAQEEDPAVQIPPGSIQSVNELGSATGWQIAQGEIALTKSPLWRPDASQKLRPSGRGWAYFGLALPLLLLAVGGATIGGAMRGKTAGKLILLLATAGLTVSLGAVNVDYVDDMFDSAEKAGMPAPPCAAAKDLARDMIGKVVHTRATGWLWGSLALYGFVGLCGFAAAATSAPVGEAAEAQYHSADPFAWQTDPSQAASASDLLAPGPRARTHPGQPAYGQEDSFGIDITPEEVRQPKSGTAAGH